MRKQYCYQTVDRKELAKDLDEIHIEMQNRVGDADIRHFKRMERWGRMCSLAGYATAWVFPNPISAFLISQGSFTRWTQMTHPIAHKGYDKLIGLPKEYHSDRFAKGWRRFIDWPDWITPEGWHEEHDVLHHYNLGEERDPDQLEKNSAWLRGLNLPISVKYILVYVFTAFWKFSYYAPRTHKEFIDSNARKRGKKVKPVTKLGAWSLFTENGRALWFKSILPYAFFRFVLLPAMFFPLGESAVINVFLTSLLAEAFTNMHSFLVIVPNHAGDDVMMFDTKGRGKGEFYLRQILGSVNYPTGSDFNDFFYGWLNYQIEHHIWPGVPLLQYQYAQPKLVAVCKKHGIPYQQGNVIKRLFKAVDIMVGKTSMLRLPANESPYSLDDKK